MYTAVEEEREAAKEGSIFFFFELVVIVTVMQMMAGKASVQTYRYIASTSAEHLSVCEGCSGMCETCVSVLMSACADECVCEACAAYMFICVAEIRQICVCCMCVLESCSALICRQAVRHV